jgi:hypothetical protein
VQKVCKEFLGHTLRFCGSDDFKCL